MDMMNGSAACSRSTNSGSSPIEDLAHARTHRPCPVLIYHVMLPRIAGRWLSDAFPDPIMTISTHVLDTMQGKPAEAVPFRLLGSDDAEVASGTTNSDGRTNDLAGVQLIEGVYRMVFDTASYFYGQNITEYFYPKVEIFFQVKQPAAHYHIPLILSPYGFSTYRGS